MSNADLAKSQQFADDYVEHYELEADEGTYYPSEQERLLIKDAINGLIGDEDFCDLIANEVLERQERRAAAGDCLACGAPNGTHWGQCDGRPRVKFGPSSSPETPVELSPSEAASVDKALARSPRRVSETRPDDCTCTSGALQPSDGCPHHGNL